ncbi:MAG: hypothetical protein Q4C01_01720 [Clostridia bacterium]|nr:hypothetical protein [Clostridia bacterium]
MKKGWEAFLKRMKADKRFSLWVYGGAVAFALALYFLGGSISCQGEEPDGEKTAESTAQIYANDELEKRLIEVLSQIRGAGKVEVMVTYQTRGEIVTATINQTDESVSESETSAGITRNEDRRVVTEVATVTNSGGTEPIILSELEPVVRGVIVVAEGAADPAVRMDLQRAVAAVTGVPLGSIEVFEMTWGS